MAVSTEVLGDGDTHGASDFVIVFKMASDAFHCLDMLDKDRVLRILELFGWVGVAESI